MESIQYVYDNIALDFDKRRYQIWPVIKKFINSLESNSSVADIGCGNGKNMALSRKDLKFKGMDLSNEFVKICISKGLDVIQGNILKIQFEDESYDNSMSIAVIHHLEKRCDRIMAISELLRITKINGNILIYVWAFKQPPESKRQFITYDEMVPYKTKTGEIFYRYYHLYQDNELESEINEINKYKFVINETGYDRGNYYVILKKIG
jgi:tRNA (uracil-5-)-methyltransferase TRM9